jgi:hypothetical protein
MSDQPSNEDVVVHLAIDVLIGKGSIEPECVDDELLTTLRRLYHENPICQTKVEFTDDLWHNMYAARPGEYLAAALHLEWQLEWERACPIWTCACGSEFKVGEHWPPRKHLYRIADGMFGELVGSVDGKGHGEERNRDCPDCGRAFAETIARREDPQLGLFDV